MSDNRPEDYPEYITRLPKAVPEGKLLVHNHVRPTRRLGERGFRAWLTSDAGGLEPCNCGWASELGPHYRVMPTSGRDAKTSSEDETP